MHEEWHERHGIRERMEVRPFCRFRAEGRDWEIVSLRGDWAPSRCELELRDNEGVACHTLFVDLERDFTEPPPWDPVHGPIGTPTYCVEDALTKLRALPAEIVRQKTSTSKRRVEAEATIEQARQRVGA